MSNDKEWMLSRVRCVIGIAFCTIVILVSLFVTVGHYFATY